MNSQEREIIEGIFERLKQAGAQPRDPEAERLIADRMRSQPYAPYAMAQLIYVQEEAIKSLNQQLEEMRAELSQGGQSSGGFLSSIFGGGRQEPPRRPQGQPYGAPGFGQPGPGYGPQAGGFGPQAGGPWGGQQAGMMGGAPGGGGFLRGAMTTAAGVAGGMLLGNALVNAFSGNSGAAAAAGLDTSALSGLGGDTAGAGAGLGGGDADLGSALGGGGFQDASFADSGDLGGDFGGGSDDDWA